MHLDTKICPECDEFRAPDEFTKDKSRKSGLSRICKYCSRKRNRESYEKHKSARIQASKTYYEDHREEKREYRQQRDKEITDAKVYISRDEKRCYFCENIRDIDDFNKRSASIDGHDNICRSCQSLRRRKYNDLLEKLDE